MKISFRPYACLTPRIVHPTSLFLALGIPYFCTNIARAEDKYWNGSGNNGSGVWTTASWWSLNASGTTPAASGVYGGDLAIFSTSSITDPHQISNLGGNLQASGLRFTQGNAISTTLLGGNGNRTLTLFGGGIQVETGAGAVTIGSASEKQRVNLSVLPGSWINNSSGPLIIQNDVKVSNYGTLSIAGSGDVTVNGSISQNENVFVEKSGAGVLTLSGTNSYKGTTTVSGGTLDISGNQRAATGNLTVSGTGTRLAGSGTIGGNTSIGSGAIHSSGAVGAVGKQTFDQPGSATTNLTYSSGSIFSWDIDRTQTQTRGVGYDAVDVTGTLASTTGAIFRVVIGDNSFNDPFWDTARTWSDIFTNGSTASNNWAAIFTGTMQYFTTGGSEISPTGQGSFSLSGNSLAWNPQAGSAAGAAFVPEPSAAIAGLLLAAGLLRRRR